MNELRKMIARIQGGHLIWEVNIARNEGNKQLLKMLEDKEQELGNTPSDEEVAQSIRQVFSEYHRYLSEDKEYYYHLHDLMTKEEVEILLIQVITWYVHKEILVEEFIRMVYFISCVEIHALDAFNPINLRIRNLLEQIFIKNFDYERIRKSRGYLLHIAVNLCLPNLVSMIKNAAYYWYTRDIEFYNLIMYSVEIAERNMRYLYPWYEKEVQKDRKIKKKQTESRKCSAAELDSEEEE